MIVSSLAISDACTSVKPRSNQRRDPNCSTPTTKHRHQEQDAERIGEPAQHIQQPVVDPRRDEHRDRPRRRRCDVPHHRLADHHARRVAGQRGAVDHERAVRRQRQRRTPARSDRSSATRGRPRCSPWRARPSDRASAAALRCRPASPLASSRRRACHGSCLAISLNASTVRTGNCPSAGITEPKDVVDLPPGAHDRAARLGGQEARSQLVEHHDRDLRLLVWGEAQEPAVCPGTGP